MKQKAKTLTTQGAVVVMAPFALLLTFSAYAEIPFSNSFEKLRGEPPAQATAPQQTSQGIVPMPQPLDRDHAIDIWQGTVTHSGGGSYPVTASLNGRTEGKTVGAINYPTLGCSGSLPFPYQGLQGSMFVYVDRMDSVKAVCARRGVIRGAGAGEARVHAEWLNQSGLRYADAAQKKQSKKPKVQSTAPGSQRGKVIKASSCRVGPEKHNEVIAILAKSTEVRIVKKQGNWLRVKGRAKGGKTTTCWIQSRLISTDDAPASTETTTADTQTAEKTAIAYMGYSKEFMPIKQKLTKGKAYEVAKIYQQQEEKVRKTAKNEIDVVKRVGFLRWLERGTQAVDTGGFDNAIEDFLNAEWLLEERKKSSKIGDWFKTVATFTAETLLGQEEYQAYRGEGYERVLMLNYKSLAYLLQGDRRAYNVTRRAIEWQNMEKKAFDLALQDAKERLAEKEREAKRQGQDAAQKEYKYWPAKKAYTALEKKATKVPSAYVNPFGFYVAGVVQELESYSDWSLRDNAKISYQKALELNPDSAVLKQAVKDLKERQAPSNSRLIHVIVADGFVPEKKVLASGIKTENGIIPVKLPIYEPVTSKVHRVEVQTTRGKRLAKLSPIADVEAICLRHQKDTELFRKVRVLTAVLASVMTRAVAEGTLGKVGKKVADKREELSAPDTRSWMSLPATIQAARLHLRKRVSKLKIVTYDKNGRKLASRTVKIDRNSPSIIYARTIDKVLYAHSAKRLWIADL